MNKPIFYKVITIKKDDKLFSGKLLLSHGFQQKVAEKAGFSKSRFSSIINNGDPIEYETYLRIKKAVKEVKQST